MLCAAGLVIGLPDHAQRHVSSVPFAVILTDEQEEYPLGLHMEVLEDPSGELTIDQVTSPEYAAKFTPSREEAPNYGYTSSAYWVRLRLDNRTRQTNDWLLELSFANMHYVDLYTPRPGGGFDVRQTGSLRPTSTRDLLYPKIVFQISLPAHSQQTYYLRFQNGASMTLPLTLWMEEAFWDHSQRLQMMHHLYFGALLGLLVYHLFLLYSLRETSYLYFVFLLASLFLLTYTYEGYVWVYFFPNLYALPDFLPLVLVMFLVANLLFSDTFLELSARFPTLHRMNMGFVASWGVLTLLVPLTSYLTLAQLAVPWAVVTLAMTGVAGVATLVQGYHPAGLFLLAWVGMGVSILLLLLVRLDVASSNLFNENVYFLGVLWMALCWSLAQAFRINLLKAGIENANRDLRNSELRIELIAAEERNRLARDLHDSVTQTLFTASVLAEATPRIWDKDPGIARQNMNQLSLLIRGALAEMRSMLIELRSGELYTQALDQLLVTLVEAARAHTTAEVSLSVTGKPVLPKDVTQVVYRVAQEALNNAIHHAAPSHIGLSLLVEPGGVELLIQDDGCGFDPQAMPAGNLGLVIMVERAAGIGAELCINSQPGHGTEIMITWSGQVGGLNGDGGS